MPPQPRHGGAAYQPPRPPMGMGRPPGATVPPPRFDRAGYRPPPQNDVVPPRPSRHRAAHRPAPTGPSIGTSVVATTAAVGAVATGAFTALATTGEGGTAGTAAADAPYNTMLASSSASLDTHQQQNSSGEVVIGSVSFVDVGDETAGSSEADLGRLVRGAELAEQHAKVVAEQEKIKALIRKGGVDGWVAEALQIMDLPQSYAPAIKKIIMKESNGNPKAINNWDSNARAGNPSQGLMQTIPVTFRKYVHPSLKDRSITDPVANITAGVRYMIDRYGVATLQQGGRKNASGGYVGY